jgi:hypothetical protein
MIEMAVKQYDNMDGLLKQAETRLDILFRSLLLFLELAPCILK